MRQWLALVCGLLLFLHTPVNAAVTANSFIAPQTPANGKAQIISTTSTLVIANNGASVTSGAVTAYTCGANGSKITGIFAGSNDTAAMTLQVILVNTTVYALATVTVGINAGSVVGTPVVNILTPANMPGLPMDSDGNPYLYCNSGDLIRVGVLTTAVTANKYLSVVVVAADF